jgi:hypothetical protein
MRLIKNFIHNINDVVLAMIIVAIAAGVIYWRMQVIFDYPKKVVENQTVTEETAGGSGSEEAADEEAAEQENSPAAESTEDDAQAEPAPENTENAAPAEETSAENAE